MNEQRILFTSVFGPYGIKNDYAEALGMQMELLNIGGQSIRGKPIHSKVLEKVKIHDIIKKAFCIGQFICLLMCRVKRFPQVCTPNSLARKQNSVPYSSQYILIKSQDAMFTPDFRNGSLFSAIFY